MTAKDLWRVTYLAPTKPGGVPTLDRVMYVRMGTNTSDAAAAADFVDAAVTRNIEILGVEATTSDDARLAAKGDR